MNFFNIRKYNKAFQHLISIALVLLVTSACYFSLPVIDYKTVALILLMTVSVVAMLFDILPVLVAAVLSALIWNFFFIPPIYTFHIDNTADLLMFLLYFFIALVNAILTFKIREAEKRARDKEEKEKTIKLYNTLLNSLSHELRTPIATIIGAVDTLEESKNKLSANNRTELLNEINKASARLNRQVENLLNMSRLESGMLKPKADWCDLNELVYAVIQKISQPVNRQIVFKPEENLPLVKLDAGLLEQVLHNLVYNAIQYNSENTIVEIKASYETDYCTICVSDNGKGIPESEAQEVFQKFYRLPNSKAGGSGLGLSIVKGFVEAMNGKVVLSNNMDGGARFTIEIPAETSFLSNLKNE